MESKSSHPTKDKGELDEEFFENQQLHNEWGFPQTKPKFHTTSPTSTEYQYFPVQTQTPDGSNDIVYQGIHPAPQPENTPNDNLQENIVQQSDEVREWVERALAEENPAMIEEVLAKFKEKGITTISHILAFDRTYLREVGLPLGVEMVLFEKSN